MTHNIVVGVDGSQDSFVALEAAADLATQTNSVLHVVFVHDPAAGAFTAANDGTAEVYIEQTIAELEATSRERTFHQLGGRHVEWTFDVALGEAARELVDFAKAHATSLIVVGGRGHSLLGGLLLGSVAQKLVRSSPISVLVVRHPEVGDQRVGVATESAPSR